MKGNKNRNLTTMKQEYENYPVPEEALKRMEAGIMKAKKENQKNNIYGFIKGLGLSAAAALLVITVLANSNAAVSYAMEKIPIIGAIAEVVTFRTFSDRKDNFEANVEIPKISLEQKENSTQETDEALNENLAAANKSIEEYANELIAEYEKKLQEDNGEGHFAVDSTYKVVTDTDKYLCLRIDTTQIMASGAQFVKIFTIDKLTGNVVSLSELLSNDQEKLTAVSDNIREQMTAQMTADESIMYFINSEMPETDFNGLEGNESFYFNEKNELVIAFDEYTVAPGYMGAVEFTIPSSVSGI